MCHIILLFVLLPACVFGQWWKLKTFDRSAACVYFNKHTHDESVGFASIGNFDDISPKGGEIWKTTDKGKSWYKVFDGKSMFCPPIFDIDFKDSLTGWAITTTIDGNPINSGVLKTTNAGETWTFSSLEGHHTAIHYNHYNKRLILSSSQTVPGVSIGMYYSDDGGGIWSHYTVNYPNDLNGTAFVNDTIGIVVSSSSLSIRNPWYKTTDGGISWNQIAMYEFCYEPLGIWGTNIIFAAGLERGKVLRSLDAGETWSELHDYGSLALNGTIRGDLSRLYVQGWRPDLAIMVSEDSGNTFTSICGPTSVLYSRFHVTLDKICYATDLLNLGYGQPHSSLWVNTTGRGSGERLLLSTQSTNKELTMTAGSIGEVIISLPDTLPTIPLLLDSITLILTYNTDLLTNKTITPTADWFLAISQESKDKLSMRFRRIGFTNTTGKEIAKVSFQANLTDTTETTIIVDSVFYNQGEIVNCSPIIEEQVHVTVEDACGDSIIRAVMLTPKLTNISSIHPNPTTGDVTVDFTSLLEREATLELLDDLGSVVYEEKLSAKYGMNSHTIPIPKFWSGTFYLRLQIGKTTVTGKFVKQ